MWKQIGPKKSKPKKPAIVHKNLSGKVKWKK